MLLSKHHSHFLVRCVSQLVVAVLLISSTMASTPADYQQLKWTDLLPEDDWQALADGPDLSNIEESSALDMIKSDISSGITNPVTRYEQALVSVRVKEEYNNRKVKIPGYIVPIDVTEDDAKATTFFLVPFFGACIHVPPPPPNQIIYATYSEGVSLDNLLEPYWIEATLSTETQTNEMATAAYSAKIDKMYVFSPDDDY